MGKERCAKEIPEDYGLSNPGPCLLPKGHTCDHVSFLRYDNCAFWRIDEVEESLVPESIPEEKILPKLEEEWEGNVPKEILDLFKDDEDENDGKEDE